jgi:Rhodopirellula transposase DDE domain
MATGGRSSMKSREKEYVSIGREINTVLYPPGCSNRNPIEHRLFCHAMWALKWPVLQTIELPRDQIRLTTSSTGLMTFVEIACRAHQMGAQCQHRSHTDIAHSFRQQAPLL